jgi:hypothetical protein
MVATMTAVNRHYETPDLLSLIAEDEVTHGRDKTAVMDAVLQAASECGGRISRNDVAPHLPAWVFPPVVGATTAWLVRQHALTAGGAVRSTDRKGGNAGRWTSVYRVNFTRLTELCAERTTVA